ncbi:MAG: ArsO family NAD(P)H-dependent flavin-containing monooxygenase [Nitrolancea sp.]
MKTRRTLLEQRIDVVVIGGGQSGLATGYYLRRTGLSFVILDAQPGPGGAWSHTWPSLRLFSPARWCSLPGWIMPGGPDAYPPRNDLLAYLTAYEERYRLPIQRPVQVRDVRRSYDRLLVESDRGVWAARAVVSATGTWSNPYIPDYPGRGCFAGTQIHSAQYPGPEPFRGQRVLIVGGANSAAQILAEVSEVAETTWVTRREPSYLPDDVDGRDLFEWATARYFAAREGRPVPADVPQGGLGDIVMVESVRDARRRGVLKSMRSFSRLIEHGAVWPDGSAVEFDAIIWCTGFRPALDHLRGLGVFEANGEIEVQGTRSVREPLLWLVGYGEWAGYASATLIGVGRSARQTALEIGAALS